MVRETKNKLLQNITNTLLFLCFIMLPYYFFRSQWSSFEHIISPMFIKIVFMSSFQIGTVGLNYLIYGTIYQLELPFFEKLKIDSRPWPWYEDPTYWKVVRSKLFNCLWFNVLVVGPLYGFFLMMTTDPANTSAQFPSP